MNPFLSANFFAFFLERAFPFESSISQSSAIGVKFNLDDADWSFTPSEPNKGFWNKIKCFFRGLFGKSC